MKYRSRYSRGRKFLMKNNGIFFCASHGHLYVYISNIRKTYRSEIRGYVTSKIKWYTSSTIVHNIRFA